MRGALCDGPEEGEVQCAQDGEGGGEAGGVAEVEDAEGEVEGCGGAEGGVEVFGEGGREGAEGCAEGGEGGGGVEGEGEEVG
jgi:hypothetical protein